MVLINTFITENDRLNYNQFVQACRDNSISKKKKRLEGAY